MLSTEENVLPESDYYIYTPSALAQKTFLYPVAVGYFKYGQNYYLRRNAYDSFLIMLIKKGECYIETNGQTYKAIAGQIVFLDCYKPHAYWTTEGWEAQWLHFDGIQAQAFYEAVVQNNTPVLTLLNSYRAEKYLHKLYLHFKENISAREALFNNYIVDVLTEFFVSSDLTKNDTGTSNIIEDTIAFINEHLRDALPLDDLARQASLSPFYFSRLFKKETGYSPHEYIITTRVNNAKYMLTTTDDSIKDICFTCGFANESSFCTTFKKVVGLTPSEYREGARNS